MSNFVSKKRFIILISFIMGITAFSIDAILPAFSDMTIYYQLTNKNDIQKMVFFYLLGFASTQLIYGFLSDSFGRRKIIISGLIIYSFASFILMFTPSFESALKLRFLQGVGVSGLRIAISALVRDLYSGNEMSRINSYILMTFLFVPIIAPISGLWVIKLGSWRYIFILFFVLGISFLYLSSKYIPETIHERKALSWQNIKNSLISCLSNKETVIYIFINGMLYSMLVSYLSQAEQIFQRDVYALGDWFPYIFALGALGMVFSSYFNGRIVLRFGMQKMLNAALIFLVIIDTFLLLTCVIFAGKIPLWLFVILLTIHFMAYNLSTPNLNALIMEPHAKNAGVVAAIVGNVMMLLGLLIAHISSSRFNGTLYPLLINFVVCAWSCFTLNLVVNRLKGKKI